MALADGMRKLVNDIKVSRASRKEFAKGNKQNTKNIMEENRNMMANMHDQNQQIAKQIRESVAASEQERKTAYKQMAEAIQQDLKSIRQASKSIVQGAQGYMNELREDSQLAKKHWDSLINDTPIPEESSGSTKIDEGKEKEKEVDKVINTSLKLKQGQKLLKGKVKKADSKKKV